MMYALLSILMQGRILFSKRKEGTNEEKRAQIWVAYAYCYFLLTTTAYCSFKGTLLLQTVLCTYVRT